jgi:hypothetical protein
MRSSNFKLAIAIPATAACFDEWFERSLRYRQSQKTTILEILLDVGSIHVGVFTIS